MRKIKKSTKKLSEREREREREREGEPLFCEGKLCIEWKRLWRIYSKSVWIRRDKNKGKEEEWY